ncbi:MAG: fimbrillin family protein [Prevotellaceae bacterium]|jgi:hypothetical protein|nr:fimbrillin family protein [Prevotellaceae bacterium]
MKKIFYLFIAVAIFLACNQNNDFDIQSNNSSNAISFVVEKMDLEEGFWDTLSTKTSINSENAKISWAKGDRLGVIKINNNGFVPGQKHLFSIVQCGEYISNGECSLISDPENFKKGKHLAYYPYDLVAVTQEQLTFNLPEQVQSSNGTMDNFSNCDFMYSNITTVDAHDNVGIIHKDDSENNSDKFYFKHALAFLEFNINHLTENETLFHISMESDVDMFGQSVFINSTGDINYGNYTNTTTLHVNYTFGNNDSYKAYLLISPTPESGKGENITIRLTTDKAIYEIVKQTPPVGFQSGYRYKVNITGCDPVTQTWDGSSWSSPSIEGSIIKISNASELSWLARLCNNANFAGKGDITESSLEGYTVILTNDIYLNNKEWTPIANAAGKFNGIFDGNGKTIYGLSISNAENLNKGLFGVNSGVIKNVTIYNPSILSNKNNVGGIVGNNQGIVENCRVFGGTITGNSIVGGIAGNNLGTIIACVNTSAIQATNSTGNSFAGGIAGVNGADSDATHYLIIACLNNADITATHAGGIAGRQITRTTNDKSLSAIISCVNNSENISGNVAAGSIVGQFQYGFVKYCLYNNNELLIHGTRNVSNTDYAPIEGIGGTNNSNSNKAYSGISDITKAFFNNFLNPPLTNDNSMFKTDANDWKWSAAAGVLPALTTN